MQVIPVLDLIAGRPVHAVAGERKQYQPLALPGLPAASPLDAASWYREHFGLAELYVADLTAIEQRCLDLTTLQMLAEEGFRMTLDAGLAARTAASQLTGDSRLAAAATGVVLGLESVESVADFASFVDQFGPRRAVFSLDLRGGKPITSLESLESWSPRRIARLAIESGFQRLIVLDLARVGVGAGLSVLELCASLKADWPTIELTSGGGVRDVDDLRKMAAAGCQRALVATALLRGTLSTSDLATL
ncbi:MAG: HisA/HisF-related TIM barrel protein [Pirellulales bacterium]